MDRQSELAEIERFIATKEATRCPPAFAVPTPNAAMTSAEEEARLREMALPKSETIFEKTAARVRLARARKSNDGRSNDTRKIIKAPKQAVSTPRGKAIEYLGVAYASRMELARALVPVLGRTEGGIQQLLIKFDNDPVAAVNYARHARKRSARSPPSVTRR